MKGLVFELFRKCILSERGEETWSKIQSEADVEGPFHPQDDRPYQDLIRLLEAAEPHIGRSGREAQRWFGRRAFSQLAASFYHVFKPHDSTRSFVLSINTTVHPEVEERFPGAEVPFFHIDEHPDRGDLRLRYASDRGLCSFGEGLIQGAGNLYGEKVTVEQPRCVHEGDPHCDLVVMIEGDAQVDPFETLLLPRRRSRKTGHQREQLGSS